MLNYRELKNFSFENFKEDISEALLGCRNSYESPFKTELDKHSPKRKKWPRKNNKAHMSNILHQTIMKCSKLKNETNWAKLILGIIRNSKNM